MYHILRKSWFVDLRNAKESTQQKRNCFVRKNFSEVTRTSAFLAIGINVSELQVSPKITIKLFSMSLSGSFNYFHLFTRSSLFLKSFKDLLHFFMMRNEYLFFYLSLVDSQLHHVWSRSIKFIILQTQTNRKETKKEVTDQSARTFILLGSSTMSSKSPSFKVL